MKKCMKNDPEWSGAQRTCSIVRWRYKSQYRTSQPFLAHFSSINISTLPLKYPVYIHIMRDTLGLPFCWRVTNRGGSWCLLYTNELLILPTSTKETMTESMPNNSLLIGTPWSKAALPQMFPDLPYRTVFNACSQHTPVKAVSPPSISKPVRFRKFLTRKKRKLNARLNAFRQHNSHQPSSPYIQEKLGSALLRDDLAAELTLLSPNSYLPYNLSRSLSVLWETG